MLTTMEGVGSAGFVPQVVQTLHTWFTPTVLFVLLNIVIGTIAVTSRMRPNHNNPRRTPSLLSRVSSLGFSRKTYEDEPMDTWSPQPAQTEAVDGNAVVERDVEMEEKQSGQAQDGGGGLSQRAVQKKSVLGRSKSDSHPLGDPSPPPPLPVKMHKYSTFEVGHKAAPLCVVSAPPSPAQGAEYVEEEEEESGADAEVNAKADDFINKFKRELKMQRLKSLVRYNETLRRT